MLKGRKNATTDLGITLGSLGVSLFYGTLREFVSKVFFRGFPYI
jgi:hypothetical protein